jgi:hypothetical protein
MGTLKVRNGAVPVQQSNREAYRASTENKKAPKPPRDRRKG